MEYDPRIKLDAFQAPTTYLTDYQKFIPHKREYYSWPYDRQEPPPKPQIKFVREDPESFQKWKKDVYIPFNLFIEPRPIIDTHPEKPYPKLVKETPVDKGKEEAMKTRPRLYISPAVSLDDVPSAEMRQLLCEYMYTSDWKKAAEEAAQGVTKRPLATSTWESGCDPIALHTDVYPPLPEGWRKKGKAWDGKQRRGGVDPTQTFWLHKDPEVKCGACTNPFKGVVPQETKDIIADLIKHDKLRLAHDRPIPLYDGYQPRLSKGVPLSKVDLPVTHPFLSTSQAITRRYVDDKKT